MPTSTRISFKPRRTTIKPTPAIEWAVWVGVCTSLIGGAAWCAGEAYTSGYWSAVGLHSELASHSSQELAFLGFVGSFQNWFFMFLFFAGVGAYGLLMEFLSTLHRKRDSNPSVLAAWLKRRFPNIKRRGRMDPVWTRIFGLLTAMAIGPGAVVVILLGVWVVAAEAEGRHLMERHVCRARTDVNLPSTVILGDGRKLVGKYLSRSEKTGILLDRTSIYEIQFSEKPVLHDVTDVSKLACTK